ncbi:hypothetical protein [Alkaliphilus sp. B6464]|uniref:hypothetical protein n=1 Tax=Alkaliphilus sp. B6464 TaxID=2731219 RepID=UPI001BABC773|nr:hypothetical protein [Alkaliphilus sp. B6464]QUH21065.1 hypothetical protein HYG84_15055 [Alkaliphilus sp. B6464]
MVQVINGEIIQYNLPKVGTLKDSSTVSGYHLLDEEILKQEGWLPLEDILPEYDEQTQYLIDDGYEILQDKVIKKYKVENIPIEEEIPTVPSEVDILKAQNKALVDRQEFLEDIIAEMAMMVYD